MEERKDEVVIGVEKADHQHRKPCDECAFARSCKPGLLGGSPAEVYIGQCEANFRIPCHKRYSVEPGSEDWKRNVANDPECVGYAIFRANIGKEEKRGLLSMPADKELCFSSYAEFMAHHYRIALGFAKAFLVEYPAAFLARIQQARAGKVITLIPKDK
jgi:hypothetical protein